MIESINTTQTGEIKPGTIIEVIKNGVPHPGVVVTEGSEIMVIYNSRKSGCVVMSSLESFCEGRRFRVSRRYRPSIPAEGVVENAHILLGKKYDAMNYNGGHFITDAMGEKPWSQELRMGAGVLGLLLAAFAIGRKIKKA